VRLAIATDCESTDEDILYWTAVTLAELQGVESAKDCRAKCEGLFFCSAWTWGKDPQVEDASEVCFLKGIDGGEEPHPLKQQGMVSGRPCRGTAASHAAASDGPADGGDEDGHAPVLEAPMTYDVVVCGAASDNLDFKSSIDLGEQSHIGSWEFCLAKCELTPECSGWTWGKIRSSSKTDKCWLHGLAEGEEFIKENDPSVISGDVCHTLSQNRGKGSDISLFCWALMLPGSYEVGLLGMQHEKGINIFACDGSKVYSNVSVTIGGKFQSTVVNVNLQCSMGGEFGTALNTEIFIEVWKKLIADADYLKYDWTVKTDPDTVWFPKRLQAILVEHPEEAKGVFLNNCWRGMHGPIEVFSKNAVTTWGAGIAQCMDVLNQVCSGMCEWGEDMWIDQCLWKILQVRRDDVFELLIEDHCDPPDDDGWRTCHDASMVAYHPFKKEDEYVDCLKNSQAEAGEDPEESHAAESQGFAAESAGDTGE